MAKFVKIRGASAEEALENLCAKTPKTLSFSIPDAINSRMKTISVTEFARRFKKRVAEQNASVTWFLGAGCSISSKIPAAGALTLRWLQELHDVEGHESTFEDWTKAQFPDFDAKNPAAHYSAVFGRLHPSPGERQQEIERICSRGEPSYGYGTLAQIISASEFSQNCNTVLTTNFDDLIADAVYLYGDRKNRPLIVAHEALARYVNVRSTRPKIIKLHGDALLDPKNLAAETSDFNASISDILRTMLQDSAIVFVGYGGNDRSVCNFLSAFSNRGLSHPVYWIGQHDPCTDMTNWLERVNATRVDHTDFDSLMHLVRGQLGLALISESAWMQRYNEYYSAYETQQKNGTTSPQPETEEALKAASRTAETSLSSDRQYALKAYGLIKSSLDEAEVIFKEGLKNHPSSSVLLGTYANFLRSERKDMDAAETFYKRAIDADPGHANNLGNYAIFLRSERKDMDDAEAFYKRAIDADPGHANNLGNYASFLRIERKDMDDAEAFYKRAIDADPGHANNLGNYANFLRSEHKDMDAAEAFYKRAIDADPSNATHLGNYAIFLRSERKDMDAAEAFYKRAIDADPGHANNLGNYANFLCDERKDMDAAEAFYKRAIDADPNDADNLGNYAQLLLGRGDRAEGLATLVRAFQNTRPETNPALLAELNIYRYAHVPDECAEALNELRRLVSSGARSHGWDFGMTLQRAPIDQCPNVELLRGLIRVVSEDADPKMLVSIRNGRPFRNKKGGLLSRPLSFGSSIQEASQLPAPARVLEFPQRLRFDLADAFAGDRELLADFFQRVVGVHADAKAHAQHAFLTRGERGEHAGGCLAQVRLDGRVHRKQRHLVLDEVAEV